MKCHKCDEFVAKKRWALGYRVCLPCGDEIASRVVRCVVPMHKSNYMLVTNQADLIGVNNKGGLVK
jgi:ribosomal protein L37AE/L43A